MKWRTVPAVNIKLEQHIGSNTQMRSRSLLRWLLLHAAMPSAYVCSNPLSSFPHFPDQAPPFKQQVDAPMGEVLHLGHGLTGLFSIGLTGFFCGLIGCSCGFSTVAVQTWITKWSWDEKIIWSFYRHQICNILHDFKGLCAVKTKHEQHQIGNSTCIRLPSLHASMPSNHVCSKLSSPGFPHVPNQAPPRRQQLIVPDLVTPHLGHLSVTLKVVSSATGVVTCCSFVWSFIGGRRTFRLVGGAGTFFLVGGGGATTFSGCWYVEQRKESRSVR